MDAAHISPDPTDITTLYIVRHGESLDNAGIPYKRTPEGSPLTERGREQAHDVARRLANVHADAVISSNLIRARQTAEIIARDRGLPVRIIAELHERSIGSFVDRPDLREQEEYRAKFDEYDRGTDDEKMRWKLADEWESLEEAQRRFVGAVERVVDDYPAKTAIVVAHGTVMRAFLIYAGYGTLGELQEGAIDNTGYVVVETDGRRWTVVDAYGVHPAEPVPAGEKREE
ncbi:MAG TPA: histidine phosphatase family protein [Chloroflexota bacterium]